MKNIRNIPLAKLSGIKSGIGGALFPKIRQKVMALFMLNPDKRFYVRETIRILGGSPGAIHRELNTLTKVGILNSEKIGSQKYYSANKDCPVFDEVRSIVEKTFGLADVFRTVFSRESNNSITLAWIYGSIAKATETSASDIDLMVIGSLRYRDLIAILKPIEDKLQRTINPTLYSKKEFIEKVRAKNNFIRNVLKSEKVFLLGENNDLTKLVK